MSFLDNLIENFIKINRKMKRWQRMVSAMSAVIVFFTTYALILPAITLDKDTAQQQPGIEVAASEGNVEKSGDAVIEETLEEEPPLGESSEQEETVDEGSEEIVDEGPEYLEDEEPEEKTGEEAGDHEDTAPQDNGSEEQEESSKGETLSDIEKETHNGDDDDDDATVSDTTTETADTGVTETLADDIMVTESLSPEDLNAAIANGEIRLITEKTQLVFEFIDEEYEKYKEEHKDEEDSESSDDEKGDVDDGYFVYAEFDGSAKLPEGVELQVKEITKESDPELYDMYCEKTLSEVQDKYDDNTGITFAKFYDISFVYQGTAVEPSGDVKIRIEYKREIEVRKDEKVDAIHFDKEADEKPEVIESEINPDDKEKDRKEEERKNGEAEAEPMKAVEFSSDRFSVYGVVGTGSITTTFLSADGNTYEVTVNCDTDANIPAGSELVVSEVEESADKYEDYLAGAAEAMDVSADKIAYAKLLDISIVKDGKEITPETPVDVQIKLLDKESFDENESLNVIHYESEDENPVLVNGSEQDGVVSFEAEGFSVYGVFYTVDFHWVVDGKEYEFSIPGGGFVSLEHLVEALGIGAGDTDADPDENKSEDAENEADEAAPGAEEGQDASGTYDEAIKLNEAEVSEATRKFIANVESVEFSNPELVWVGKVNEDTTVGGLKESNDLEIEYSADLTEEQIAEINAQNVEAGDWALISVHPFLSNESLTVTTKDGESFTIRVTDGQLRKMVISASGETYEVIVTYGEDAQIPDSAELRVKEIHKEDEAYTDLQKKAGEELSEQLEKAIPSHPVLFDIAIYDGETEIEPAEGSSVQVEIRLVKGSVTGIYTDQSSPLLINDEPVNADNQEITQKLQVIHDVKGGSLEAVDVKETATEEKVVGQFATSSFSNWLLFLDEDLTDITVYKGDSITLRPYGEWYWKKDGEPAEIQNLNWTFPNDEYNVTWDWRYNVPIDYNGNTRNYYGITQAKTKDGKFTFNGYAKYDRELHEYYWYYHAPNLQPGDFTIYVVNDKGETRTIRVHVLDETGHENDKPGTVSGVDSIAVNLFDYDKGGVLDEGWNWNHTANNTNLATSPFNNTINIGHDLKFLSSGSGGTATGNNHGYNGYYSENVHPGIVKNDLTTEGYPELAYGTDLKYLFDTSKTSWVDGDKMIAYPNVTGLFRQDARGYYYFNSNINYAYYNPANGNKQFTLYEHTYTQSTTGTLDATGIGENAKPIGFFPFHDYESTQNLYVNQNNNLNHHLGMSMKLQFDIPQDKKINGEDIVFEFSGDDDLWVFVDGKLVLDMGGIHQPVPGTINFSGTSNNVKVYGQSDKSVTFTPGYHTMEVFYLERGGCDSNCSIMFNMPLVIGRGDFKVVKKGENTENVTLGGAVFGLWETEDCSGDPVRTATSKTSGSDRGLVEFNNLSVKKPGQVYYMKEISAPNGYVKSNKIYTVTASDSPGPDGKYTFTIREKDSSTPLDTIAEEPYTPIVYNLKQKPRNISLQKTWQNEYGETIPAPSGATATFKLHKKGYYSAAPAQERTLYKVQLQNLSAATLAQGFFYEGDQIRLAYEFDNSPINTTLSLNGTTYANLIKQNGDTGPRYVNYTVSADDADNDNQIIFKRENDENGLSHGFRTVEWQLVEAAPIPSGSTGGMEDKVIQTFTLPYRGQWSRTFTGLDTYDAEGNPFMYWFEETGTTNANGYFPVTVNDADHPLEIDQDTQMVKNLKKAAIKVIKVIKGTETPLAGAKFTLTQVDDNGNNVPGGIQKPETETGADGTIIFDNLEPGRYKLEETKNPNGYIIEEGPYYIIVNDDYTTELDISVAHTLITKAETSSVYTVENQPGPELPSTGGPGTIVFTTLGSILIAGAGLLLWRRRRLI